MNEREANGTVRFQGVKGEKRSMSLPEITEQKTGSRAGGGRVRDVELLFGSYKDGQDKERAHQRDNAG